MDRSFTNNLNATFDKSEFNNGLEISGIGVINLDFDNSLRDQEDEFENFIGGVEITPQEKLGDINVIKKITFSTAVATNESLEKLHDLSVLSAEKNRRRTSITFGGNLKGNSSDLSKKKRGSVYGIKGNSLGGDIQEKDEESEEVGVEEEEEQESSDEYSFSEDNQQDLYNLANDKSKKDRQDVDLASVFIGELSSEFERLGKEYLLEMKNLKIEKKRLRIDVERFEELEEDLFLPETRLKLHQRNFYGFIASKFGEPCLIRANQGLKICVIGTITHRIVFYDLLSQQIFEFKHKEKSIPSSIAFNERTFDIVIGFCNGAVKIIHYDDKKFIFEDWMKTSKRTKKKILQIVPLGRTMISILYVNESYELMFATRDGRGKSAKFEFEKIMGEIDNYNFNKPHISHWISKSREIVAVCSSSSTYIFEHIRPTKEDPKVVPRLELIQKIKASYADFSEDLSNLESEFGECFPIFMPRVKIERVEGDETIVDTNDYFCVVGHHHVAYYKFDFKEQASKDNSFIVKEREMEDKKILFFEGSVEINTKILFAEKFDKDKIILVDSNSHIGFYNIRKHVETVGRKIKIEKISNPILLKSIQMLQTKLTPGKRRRKQSDFQRQDSLRKRNQREKAKNFRYKESEINDIVTVVNSKLKSEHFIQNLESKGSQSGYIFGCNKQILILNSKGLWVYELMKWQDYLHECIKSQHYKLSMKTIYELIKGRNKILRETPPDDEAFYLLAPFLKKLIYNCIPYFIHNGLEELEKVVNMLIYLLIKTGSFDFIDEQFHSLMIENDRQTLYLECLKVYYERQLIPVLSIDKIKAIIEFLKEKDEADLKEEKPCRNFRKKFLKVVYNKRQHQDFCIASAIENDDFFLVVYFALDHRADSILIPIEMLRIKIDRVEENFFQKKEIRLKTKLELLDKLYWFLYEKLLGLWSLDNNPSETNQKQILRVVAWFLENKSLNWFQAKQTTLYLRFLLILFRDNFADLLDSLSTDPFVSHLKKSHSKNKMVDVSFLKKECNFLVSLLLKNSYSEFKDRDESIFDLFLAVISVSDMKGVDLDPLCNKLTFINLIEAADFVIKSKILEENQFYILLHKIFREIKYQCTNENLLMNLLKKSSIKLQAAYYELVGDLKNAFKTYQKMIEQDEIFIQILFEWVKQGLQRSEEKVEMMKVIKSEFEFLILTDHEEFSKILKLIPVESQIDYVLKYKDTTKSKYMILEKILKFMGEKEYESEISEDFKLEYIRLMNVYERKKVLGTIVEGKYPTSQCLKICEEANNQLAVAYLKSRLGFYKEALEIYQSRLRKVMRALVKDKRIHDEGKSRVLLERMETEYAHVEDMCRELVNDSQPELLTGFLDFLVDTGLKYSDPEIKQWKKITKKFLFYALDCIKSTEFIKFLQNPDTNFTKSKENMVKTVNHFKLLKRMLGSYVTLNSEDVLFEREEYMQNMVCGPRIEIENFGRETRGDAFMIFKQCSHYYPVTSNEIESRRMKIFCSSCEEEDDQEAVRKTLLRNSIKLRKFYFPEQIIPVGKVENKGKIHKLVLKEKRMTKIQRMALYDQYSSKNFNYCSNVNLTGPLSYEDKGFKIQRSTKEIEMTREEKIQMSIRRRKVDLVQKSARKWMGMVKS